MLKTFGTISFTIVFALLALFVYTKLAGPIPFYITSVATQKTDSFSVTGEGKSSITPDKATVTLGVTATDTTADEAKNKMNENINKVTTAIKALGIEDKDIQTQNLNVYPNYETTKVTPLVAPNAPTPVKDPNSQATSYTGNTNIVVTVNQIDLANKIVDAGTKNGANQVGGVSFDNQDTTAAENDARQKAIADAKAKAETAAKAAGFTLGKIINYSENPGGRGPIPYALNAADAAGKSAPTELNPGENEITMTVTLSYEVK